MRQSMPAHECLTATLRVLATGRSYEDLKFLTMISPQYAPTEFNKFNSKISIPCCHYERVIIHKRKQPV